MIPNELIQNSPIRILEQSINGGLKAGEIGIISSPSGLGKTSVLVQIALDKLFQGKKIIHVSFTQHTNYVLTWYENIFSEIFGQGNPKNDSFNLLDVKNDIAKNRVLISLSQDGMATDLINRSLRAMIVEGGFKAEAVIIDGFNFSCAGRSLIAGIKTLAKELNISIWYSCNIPEKDGQYNSDNIPLVATEFADLIDVIIKLEPKHEHIELSVSKDRNSGNIKTMPILLDPRTLLILGQ